MSLRRLARGLPSASWVVGHAAQLKPIKGNYSDWTASTLNNAARILSRGSDFYPTRFYYSTLALLPLVPLHWLKRGQSQLRTDCQKFEQCSSLRSEIGLGHYRDRDNFPLARAKRQQW